MCIIVTLWRKYRQLTIANETTVGTHEIQPSVMFEIDGFVCGEFVDAQMFNHSVELMFVGIFTQETSNLLDFTSQILRVNNT